MRHLSIIMTLSIFSAYGQDFKMVKSNSIDDKRKIDSLEITETYSLDNFDYYVGWHETSKKKYFGLRLYVYNPDGNLIYKSNSFMDSDWHSLTFFKSKKKPKKTIILGNSGNEYSWGNEVYLIDDGKFNHIGLLDIGTYDRMDVPSDISRHTNIWSERNGLKFTFSYDSLTYNPGGFNERIIANEQIEYHYEKGQFKEKLKN